MFYAGSKAATAHPYRECVFLVQQVDAIGDPVKPVRADWFRADAGWKALDEAQRDFGNCEIVKSALASEYDAFCQAHQ